MSHRSHSEREIDSSLDSDISQRHGFLLGIKCGQINITQNGCLKGIPPEACALHLLNLLDILSLVSAAAVIIPGALLLLLLRGVTVPALRNLTIILSSFAILHGFYHLSYFIGLASVATYIDLATALILVVFGLYYSNRILAVSMFVLVIPDTAAFTVPIALTLALIIFIALALRSKSASSLQAQMSIFLIIWIVAELIRSLLVVGVIAVTYETELIGLEIHTAAMIAFGLFMVFRFYRVSSRIKDPNDEALKWLTPDAKPPGSKNPSQKIPGRMEG